MSDFDAKNSTVTVNGEPTKFTNEEESRVLKRYYNRKLYDTSTSKYVSLRDILPLYRAHNLRIIDQKTGSDITDGVLLKALFLEAKTNGSLGKELLQKIKIKGD